MPENKWIETKKEVQTNSSGEIVNENITYEIVKTQSKLSKKDYIDLIIRVFGMVAIFVPIYLFYSSQEAELNRQKSLFKFQTYTDLEAELHSFLNKHEDSISFEKSKDRILYELIPKARLVSQSDLKVYLNYMFRKVNFFHKYFLYDNSLNSFKDNFESINLYDSTNQKYYFKVNLNIMERATNLANLSSALIVANDSTESYGDSLNTFLRSQLNDLDSLQKDKKYYNLVDFPIGKFNHYKFFRNIVQLKSIELEQDSNDDYDNLINTAFAKFTAQLKKFDSVVISSNKYFQ